MQFSEFLKKDFDDFYSSITKSLEGEFNCEKKSSEEILQTLKSRKSSLKEIFQLLTSDNYRLINLEGPQGTGKTQLIKSLQLLTEENILTYYYECSPATNLDDVILSLFNFLKTKIPKDPDYMRSFRISSSLSIDERLISQIKKLKNPLLIIIDGIENLSVTEQENNRKELLNLINFISSVSTIKIILAGEGFPEFKNQNEVYKIKLKGLEPEESFKLIKDTGIKYSEELVQDILQITRGYPENIHLFSTFIKNMEILPFDLIKEIKSSGLSFEKFISEKIYSSIPEEYRELINLFVLIRHPLSIATLKRLEFTANIEQKISYLSSLMIISENNGNLHIKNNLKDYIISRLTPEESIKTYVYLHELYSSQIGKKLEERILPVSRGILYSEQYYHYKKLLKLSEMGDYEININPNTQSEQIFNQNQDLNLASNNKENDDQEFLNDFSAEGDNLKIELTEEEQKLLQEKNANTENPEPEDLSAILPEVPADSEDTEEELIKRLNLYQEQNDQLKYNSMLFKLANLNKEHFRHDQALKYYYDILNSNSQYIPDFMLCEVHEGIGEIYDYRKDFNSSIIYFTKAFEEAEKQGNQNQKARIYFKIGLTYDDAGDFDKALEFYQKNIDMLTDIEKNPYLSASCSNSAIIYEEKGLPQKAIEFYNKALDFDIMANNPEGQYETLSKLGEIYFETKNHSKAGKFFHRGLVIAKKINDPYKIAMSYIDLGDIYLVDKNYEKAVKAFLIAKKSINKTISTDSMEKINRRFSQVIKEIGRENYNKILEKFRKK